MIDRDERLRRLVRRHHLGPASEPGVERLASDLVGLHSSDPATVFVSVWARSDQAQGSIESALYEDRSLVRLHGMRRTLWVLTRRHAGLVLEGVAKDLAEKERRRVLRGLEDADHGFDPGPWLDGVLATVESLVAERPGISTTEIGDLVPEASTTVVLGGPKWGGAFEILSRLVYLLAMEGRIVRGRPGGSWVSSQYRWHPMDVEVPGIGPGAARARLVEDWLSAFGPAVFDDVAWWAGWGIRKTRSALDAVGAEPVTVDGRELLVLPDDAAASPDEPPTVSLLPSLDASVMGWKERDWYLGPHAEALFDSNGNAGPIVLVDGLASGTWAQAPDGEVVVDLIEDVGSERERLTDAAASAMTARLEGVVVRPRFPSPASKELAGRLNQPSGVETGSEQT